MKQNVFCKMIKDIYTYYKSFTDIIRRNTCIYNKKNFVLIAKIPDSLCKHIGLSTATYSPASIYSIV